MQVCNSIRRWLAGAALLFAGLLVLPASPVGAATVDVGGGPLAVTLQDGNPVHVVLSVDLGSFETAPVTVDGRTYNVIRMAGAVDRREKGFPDLPCVRRNLMIPGDREMSVRVLSETHVDLPGYLVAPSKGDLPFGVDSRGVPYSFADAYRTNDAYPWNSAELGRPYIMRDLRGVSLTINPFQYLPRSRTLRVYTHLTVEVTPAGPGRINVQNRPLSAVRLDAEFDRLYQHHFANYSRAGFRNPPEQGSLLVICAAEYSDEIQDLIDWKQTKGIVTYRKTIEEIGSDPRLVKDCIREYYNNQGVAYVLLVGDAPQVPTILVTAVYDYDTKAPGDPCYAMLEGDDFYPDLLIGRFSAESSADVVTQVERSIYYERDITSGNSAWLRRAMGLCQSIWLGGYWPPQVLEEIRDQLIDYGYDPNKIDRFYDGEYDVAGHEITPTMVRNAINEGRGFINYFGHGSEDKWKGGEFDYTKIDDPGELTNVNQLPFIIAGGCATGNFIYGPHPCFAEYWMRARQSAHQPTGAIAYFGAGTSIAATYAGDMVSAGTPLMVNETMRTVGGLFFATSCELLAMHPIHQAELTVSVMTVFGDPSLLYRSKVAESMTVDHLGSMMPGQGSYTVRVSGLTGALCALSESDQLLGAALTDQNGEAVLQLNPVPDHAAALTLTVTAPNRQKFTSSVQVWPCVHPDGSGDYETIQAAVNMVAEGTVIVLASGTFQGPGNRDIDFGGSNLVIQSEFNDPSLCVIDASDEVGYYRAFLFDDGESAASQIVGVTIKGGVGSGASPWGGAVYCTNSSPTFRNCVFRDNRAMHWGGAVYVANSSSLFDRCVFWGNSVIDPGMDENGSAIYCSNSPCTLSRCTLAYNDLTTHGVVGIGGSSEDPTIIDRSIIASNPSHAVFCNGMPLVEVSCSDFWGNTSGDWDGCIAGQGSLNDNFSENPLFCGGPEGDFHFTFDSPCNTEDCGVIGGLPALPDCSGGKSLHTLVGPAKSLELRLVGANPVRGTLACQLVLSRAQWVRLAIFDVSGREVATLHEGPMGGGPHDLFWKPDGRRSLSNGLYLLRAQAEGHVAARSFLLMK